MKITFTILLFITSLTLKAQEEIVGGGEPEGEEYPWMCSIILDYPTAGCGASLIRPQWVLTAGHCELSDFGINSEHVLINSLTLDLDDLQPYAELIDIEYFIVHEDYVMVDGYGPDIALIRLAEPSTITPIGLAGLVDSDYYEHGDNANVLGWGTTLDGDGSDVLLHASCRFFGDDECAEKYALSESDPSMYELNEGANICAGYFEGEDPAGAAAGDSGGPLFFTDADGDFVQVGVVSGGESSITMEEFPGVFTLVPAYLEWIENTIADYELATSLASENREHFTIKYYADDYLEVTGLQVDNNYEMGIYDNQGQLILSDNLANGVGLFSLSVNTYSSGMYVLQVLNQTTGNVTAEKFIVK